MCGFAASFDLHGLGRAIPWALEALRHRGPDGRGTLEAPDGNWALEHCRLAIIDPHNRSADQPFSDPSGRWSIVFNGEIFNFRQLRRELVAAGVRFRTDSDTEVLLLGYLELGKEILRRLRGMFAFVICDRLTGSVFAARDQLGVKPLYWTLVDGLFVAASELRPVLAHPACEVRFDPAGVVEFLAFGGNQGAGTVIAGVQKLLPGHFATVERGELRIEEYWDSLPPRFEPPPTSSLEDALRDRLDDAVAMSLVSDVPLGLTLSGGLDSSLIAVLAARHTDPSAISAYSVAFGRPDDEALAAQRLARELGLRHRTVTVTELEVRARFGDWLAELDYPSGNPTWMATWFIAEAASADGVKVLLSGDGGDELFGGYTRWMEYLRFHDLVWARSPAVGRRVLGRAARGRVAGLAGDIARRAAEGGDLFVTSRTVHDDGLRACLGPAGLDALASARPEAAVERLRRRFDERMPGGDYLAWMSYASLKTKIVEDFLQRLDKMGMRHGVEGRVPLLDHRLVELASSLPQSVKVARREPKALLRAAVKPLLPDYVMDRPKQGFCAPVGSWSQELLLGAETLRSGPLYDSGLLARDALDRVIALTGAGSFSVWTLAMLVEWCNRNVPAHEPVLGATG